MFKKLPRVQKETGSGARRGRGGREEGKGHAPPLRGKHGALPDVCVLVYAHSSLTKPSLAFGAQLNQPTNQLNRVFQVSVRQRRCPAPYPAHQC